VACQSKSTRRLEEYKVKVSDKLVEMEMGLDVVVGKFGRMNLWL
jgi:hypothetical protein